MTTLEKIFQGYYNERIEGDKPDPVEMQVLNMKIMESLGCLGVKGMEQGNIMEAVSEYGMKAEKNGFMAGFRMAWELLKNMQEIENN
ncbi:hypothetical protein ACTQ50_05565 [Blautia sp. Sow4_E7]|uniref:hypothetical protein n=1 Tax=Blautia sp. Sow4_E7 TaxID=3438749 RepID=UPI003F8F6D48